MNWPEIVNTLFQVVLIPLLGVITKYLIEFISTKITEAKGKTDNANIQKYLDLLKNTVTDCVIATNQTYVDALKDKDAFDAEAQKAAFKMTYESVMGILTDDAKDYLKNILGDMDSYVTSLIEANVNANKKPAAEIPTV